MSAVVFAGPTIGAKDVQSVLEATVLPPAGQGDIFRAARQGATAIGLIDGYFQGVPSVWHKEILWALEHGIAVFGSASMGALRAAELSAFGMIGVGRIYEAYAAGAISDDDEVAVLHSPAELGFAPLSEPMVSIRATVESAVSSAVLDADQAAAVLKAAKARFYQQRTWRNILADIPAAPWLDRFSAWVKTGRVDTKREDAQEMLARMAAFLNGEDRVPGTAAEPMEHTLAWKGLVRRVEAQERGLQGADRRVLDELRLEPERFGLFRTRAALRLLALKEARREGAQAERQEILTQLNSHRQAQKLFRSKDLQNWLQENGLTAAEYEDQLEETVLAGAAVDARQQDLEPHLLAELRQAGAFAGLKARAADKELQIAAISEPGKPETDAGRLQLAVWYFETRLHRDVPEDFGAYAESIGLNGAEEFFELIRREFMYHQGCKTQSARKSRG
ncbi:TfuA-like protein [Leisingera sp. McT4-56]|uniref:TfuA-like protein n=1 Tax=Leisingera sp. McT4-56 TaxID=2881255 RepID=UPI001CF83EFE|nr:TfuA-like protein [Leisingera sp. McT4-56]MCB4458163.1 TfuA domain protein, core [Leisingera sp. McT4-56]